MPSDCTALEYQLWEIDQRIRLRQLEAGISTLKNKIDNAHAFADAYTARSTSPQGTAIHNTVKTPSQVPAHIQQMVADRASLEDSIGKSLEKAAAASTRLESVRAALAEAIDELGPLAGTNYMDTNLDDLEKARKQIEDDLLKCYSETDKHINGQPHDSSIPAQPALTCWCGTNHGAHNYTAWMTCWCGTYNDYIGHPFAPI